MAALMIQGTTSDAGKSTLVCAMARILARHHISVAPFKPQNMALNSAITIEGGEIGRAQALQAQACYLESSIHMNPILLKPNTDTGSQVIVQGKAVGNMQAKEYLAFKPQALKSALDSYTQLSQTYEHILIEGAGSPAEINLREHDLANMGFAQAIDCPVIIIADIDRGGVFAHLLGTMNCLSEQERKRVKGFVINRFRGDESLLEPAIDWLYQQTGKHVLAVLPYLSNLKLDAEDALNNHNPTSRDLPILNVVIPVLPRISNHTDFDPLRFHPQVNVQFIGENQSIAAADLVIIPSSKHTIADLNWLKSQSSNWQEYLTKHLRYGGKIMGICGGMQMLGQTISDPNAVEGKTSQASGFALLDIHTKLQSQKTLKQCQGQLRFKQKNIDATGYEIHAGKSQVKQMQAVLFDEKNTPCGWQNADKNIFVSYWHGLLETQAVLDEVLEWAGLNAQTSINAKQLREQEINRLADAVEARLPLNSLLKLF